MSAQLKFINDIEDYPETEYTISTQISRLSKLAKLKIPIPDGFILLPDAYSLFLQENINKPVVRGKIPDILKREIFSAYKRLKTLTKNNLVRVFPASNSHYLSLPVHKVHGEATLTEVIKKLWALQLSNTSNDISIIIQSDFQPEITGQLIITNSKNNEVVVKCDSPIPNQYLDELKSIGKKIAKTSYFPQVATWIIVKGKIYITDIKPSSGENTEKFVNSNIINGQPISPGIATGEAKIINTNKNDIISRSDIIIISDFHDNLLPYLRRSGGVIVEFPVTNYENKLKLRELGIPVVANIKDASGVFRQKMIITINGAQGFAYLGHKQNSKEEIVKTVTKIFSIGDDNIKTKYIDGVIFNSNKIFRELGIHPEQLIYDKKRKQILDVLVDKLGKISLQITPREVIYHPLDFSTYTYRKLAEGKTYEMKEQNPLIGFRGAYRIINDPAIFELELEAIRILKNKKGLKNISIMIPFVRSPDEMQKIKSIINKNSLYRNSNFKIYLLAQVPENLIMLEEYIEKGIDGIVFDINLLASLYQGVDLNNTDVFPLWRIENEMLDLTIFKGIKALQKNNLNSLVYFSSNLPTDFFLEKAIRAGIKGLCVKNNFIREIKESIVNIEHTMLKK